MEYEERISRGQGNYIVASSPDFESILSKEALKLITGDIVPGDYTDLHGWFLKSVRYCGILPDSSTTTIKRAVFYIGEGICDLFTPIVQYYDVTYIIAPDRIGKSYKPGSFRDCYLRESNNKYKWK